MPPSITDNPEAFFEELNKPQKEETAVEVSQVAPVSAPVVSPLTGNTEPAQEQPQPQQVSVADDPEKFFAGLTGPVEQKPETPESVVLGQLARKTGAQMDDFDMQSLDLLSPKELEEVTNTRKDIPLTENLLRTKFDYEMSLPWNEGVNTLENWKKIGQEVFGGGVSFLKGAQKFAEQSLFAEADQDPSGFGHPSFKPIKDYASGITALPESAAYLFTKLKEGGIGLKDRLSESLGMQDREKSYENYKARNLVDRIQTQEMQENPSIYSRILKGDMANDALAYVVLNTLPDRETLMAQEGLTAEQADNKRKEIANAIARQTTSDIASREKPADEDIATFATFTAPAGLGLGEMGLVSLGFEAGMGLTPKLIQGAKYLGKTDQEIKAMNDAAQALQRETAMQGLEQAQKPSLLGRASGALATGIDKVEAASARIGEATPKILKELAPPAAGALIAGGDHRGEGAIVGAVLGKAGKPALAALKYAAKTPALIRDIEEARVLAAGGSKGTFETLASFPEVSENAAKILRFGGKRLDTTLNNVVEYAKAGVNPTLIALATGALESASPEELNKLTSTGLLYGLGGRVVHQAWGKITGVDPIIDARNRRQQDIDDLKTYRDLDPETRKTLDSVTSWDNIVERHTQRAINAEQAYNDAVALGKKDAEQLGKVAQAERNILSAVNRANVQTRDEFSRQFVTQLTKLNQLVNGTLRAGQNNVGINILTPEQIVAKFRSDPANATATDQELLDVASQRGFYSTPEGAVEYQAGMSMDAPKKKIVFDRTKPSVVINADALKARMMIEGSTPIDALNHEAGHHVRNIPEFREANKDAERLLFSQEVRDLSGKIVDVTTGQYSEKALVEMYKNDYLKNKTPDEVTKLSQLAGLWDYSRGALNEGAVAEYMRDEIISELNAETFSTHLGKGLDNGVLYMLDVARLKTKKNLLDRAVQKFFGLGGKGEATSELTGATFSPEVLAANRQAIRALQSLQGEVSQAVKAVESPKISRAEMLKSKALMDRHGKYAGLFKTKIQGQIFDGNGNPIGAPIDIANPNASEGSWESRNGETKQLNGYGARPDEVAESAGVVIPDGGRLVVQKQIVTQPDGVTPVLMTPKEAKDLQKARVQVIRESLNTPDEGAPNRFEPVNDDSATWRGTFTPLQIQAIKDMPEGIIPKSIKEHMLKINDMIVRGDGGRMLVDYAAVMNDAGKYTAYSPKIYDVVPIGMQLSKAGNFLVTTISVGRMFDKLNAWSERMPARLAPWGGSKDAFFKEFTETYLQNWQYREKDAKGNQMFPRGKAGETGISGSPEEALAKKDIFNDFLNLTTNDFRGTNADRTKTPRRRGDVRGKDIDRTIMSMRLDHMAELMDNDSAPKVPINYKNAISNFLPAEEAVIEPQEERRQTPFDGITATYRPTAPNSGISFRPSTPTEEYPTSERGFYSGLQKTIDEKMPAKASPQQVLSIVNNPQNAKADEVKWSNLAGFVEGKTSVTKQEVLDYLRNEGSVKFEEVSLEGNTINRNKEYIAREIAREVAEDEAKYSEFIDPEGVDNYAELTPEQRLENTLQVGMNDFLEEAQERIDRQEMSSPSGETKYAQYVLPNGENYREVVLTMPASSNLDEITQKLYPNKKYSELDILQRNKVNTQAREKSPEYTSSHFADILNYVAHMRLDERPDAEGRDGLFIEEIQSDRHQQGREEGYDVPETHYRIYSKEFGAGGKDYLTKEEAEAAIPAFAEKNGVDSNTLVAKGQIYTSGNGIPDAPFRKDWSVQMFKRALRDAIEGEKEWIGWTKGETQAERFKLSEQVDSIEIQRIGEDEFMVTALPKGSNQMVDVGPEDAETITRNQVAQYVGKDLAEKALAQPVDGTISSYTGDDLKIGGEGMKGFYDNILPKEIGKYVKKWGAKVEEGETNSSQEQLKWKVYDEDGEYVGWFTNENDAKKEADRLYGTFEKTGSEPTPIWKIDITPEMRSSIKQGGQISFMPKSEAREKERTERLPASGADLTASLIASGTSLESFGKDTLIQLAESYGIEIPKGAKRGEIIDAINERPTTEEPLQKISSAGTSIRQVPAVFKAVKWNEGTINADIGGGKYDEFTNALQTQGVENVIYDPYNRSEEFNQASMDRIAGNADTATISNVLNVIAEPAARDQVIRQAADAIKADGEAYFSVYDGDRSGKGKETPRGYQLNRKLGDYIEEIEKHFGSVTKKGNILIAKDPVKAGASDIRFMPSSKLDETHAKAIQSGDMEEAQRLVDERASEAGFDIGTYHGTENEFNEFKPSKYGLLGSGIYTGGKQEAELYGKTLSLYGKHENPITFNTREDIQNARKKSNELGLSLTDYLKSEGYDSIIETFASFDGEPTRVFFESSQIKLADPATYDDKGKLIPLSQRFDLSKQDIRFMPESKDAYEKVKEKVPSLLPINEQPENLPVVGRLTTGQQQAIDELDTYYAEKTPQRVQELKKDAEESLSSRLTNLGIPVSDSKRIASKAFGELRKSVKGAMQVISGMGLSDLSRMAGSGRPSVETRQKISPAWLTSAFESFETDDSLALMKAQQVARQLNKADQAKVAAGEDIESAKASGVRQSTIEQGMNFVTGERTADQKAFGSSLREDVDAPPRVYASVVEGQKYGSQGNYNLFFEWDQETPMVITSHHHYGVGNGLTDIHASANIGDKNARSFGDPSSEEYDTLPSGKKVLNTRLLVGNEGASDIRAHQLMVSIPKSGLDDVKRAFKASGTKAAEAEMEKIIASQLVGTPSQGKTQAFTTDEGIPPYVAVQKNRTEAYVLNPDLQNVRRITIVSNKPKEVELITKNLQRAFENNGTKLPKVDVVSKDSGASANAGRKAITDKFFKLTGKLAFMPETEMQEPAKIDWSVFTQKAQKPLSTLKAYANPNQQDEAY